MHFTNPLASSPTAPLFPTYLIPSIPFRRRKSSVESNASSASRSSSTTEPSYLSGSASHLHCSHCFADLCPTSAIISKGFTGRHGRAYLVAPPPRSAARTAWASLRGAAGSNNLPNTSLDRAVPRQLVTGAHTVADLRCGMCDAVLGWKYVAAEEEGQRYKVGKFILETKRVARRACWEGGGRDDLAGEAAMLAEDEEEVAGASTAGGGGRPAADDGIEFDSQDEDECEDLFAGVWSPALARKRRERKQVWKKDADVEMV